MPLKNVITRRCKGSPSKYRDYICACVLISKSYKQLYVYLLPLKQSRALLANKQPILVMAPRRKVKPDEAAPPAVSPEPDHALAAPALPLVIKSPEVDAPASEELEKAAVTKEAPEVALMEKPRRYLTAYMFYIKSCWKKHRAEYPNKRMNRKAFQHFTCDNANDWHEMPPSDKRHFEKLSAKDKKRYDAEMAKWHLQEEERKKSIPKRPLSSYFFFCAQERPKVRESMPAESVIVVAKELGRRWRKLKPEQKAKFEALALTDRERYATERHDQKEKAAAEQKVEKEDMAALPEKKQRPLQRSRSASLSSGDEDFEED